MKTMNIRFAVWIAASFLAAAGWAEPEPVTVMDLVHRSQEAAQLGHLDDAIDLAHQATELDAAYAGGWKQLGALLLQEKNYAAAIEPLQTAAALDSKNAATLRDLSTAQWLSGQTNAALDSLRQACELEPLNARWARDLATWYQAGDQADKAVDTFHRALELDPADAASWRDLGWTLWKLDRRSEALAALDQAIANNVSARRDVELQVVAQLIEDKQADAALAALARWEPQAKLLELAIPLVEKGRYQAARPLLLESWNRNEDALLSGVYLAYVQALGGNRKDIPAYLAPFLETLSAKTDEKLVGLVLDAVRNVADTLDSPVLALALDDKLGKPYREDPRLLDILDKSADRARYRQDLDSASELYRRLLARDPDRPAWLAAYELALKQQGSAAAESLLADLQKRATSVVVRAAVAGLAAERDGRLDAAIQGYEKSLAADPEQPRLKQFLFNDYLQVGRLADARQIAEWVEEKINAGNDSLRSYAAEMWMALGEPERALDWWQVLHLAAPEVPYYATAAAAANYGACKPDAAIATLKEQITAAPSAQAYELLAEIFLAQGDYKRAAAIAKKGLGVAPSPGLYRSHAENSEAANLITTDSLASASALLVADPGHAQGTLLYARQLEALGMTNEAVAFHEGLLARNPDQFVSLVALKNLASARHEFRKALGYSRVVVTGRPWDLASQLRHAIALSEAERVRESLQLLRHLAKRNAPRDLVPVLLYRLVTECPYPGRNNIGQLTDHLRRLHAEGYQLVTPDQIQHPLTNFQAVVVLEDVDQPVLAAADQVLAEIGGRAVYAGNSGLLTRDIPGKPTPAYLRELAASGRWLLASSGPEDDRRQAISKDGLLGNPFTHPVVRNNRLESNELFQKRLDQILDGAAASLPDSAKKILVYPFGDYGQATLDTRPVFVQLFRDSVARHFDLAIFYDDNGFLAPGFDPLRIPARVVPAQWTADRLAEHLRRENPAVQCQLELAKLLYWNRQHEEANYWFQRALDAGADPKAIAFNWGANANQQGDLPTAIRKLEQAKELDPASPKVAETLDNAVNKERPLLQLDGTYWEDNEGRSYEQLHAEADGFVRQYLRLGGLADYNRWQADGLGDERGTRIGVSGLWYLQPQIWLEGRIWQLQMEGALDDILGGQAVLHLPNRWLGGYAELSYSRDEIETVEALRADIQADTYGIDTYSRLFDKVDAFVNGRLIDRTDGNTTWLLFGRLVYRLKEWPYLGAGYLFRFGDSDRDPPEYWAPENLEQHQLYASLRGGWRSFTYSLSGQVGYSREWQTDWQFIWGGNARLDWLLTRRLSLFLEGVYQESSTYNRTTATAGAAYRF